ncbi:MAG TPA: hypothetical protein VMF09_12565 [Solirubrobacteraceae bacterium]|nr:hypothetical protein [Solirubrobacteraceae bacterium]
MSLLATDAQLLAGLGEGAVALVLTGVLALALGRVSRRRKDADARGEDADFRDR